MKGGLEAKLNERQLRPLREFCEFINRIEAHAHREGHAGELLDQMLEAIDYEAHLYDNGDDRAAQNKWQNVLDFTQWLKTKGSGGRDGDEDHRSLLDLTRWWR
jgi:ATP-dependent DNA helicase Rep